MPPFFFVFNPNASRQITLQVRNPSDKHNVEAVKITGIIFVFFCPAWQNLIGFSKNMRQFCCSKPGCEIFIDACFTCTVFLIFSDCYVISKIYREINRNMALSRIDPKRDHFIFIL